MSTMRSMTLLLSFATLSLAQLNLAGSGLTPLNLSSNILGSGNALVSANALSNIISPSSCAANQVVGVTVLVPEPRAAVCGCMDVMGGRLGQSACPQCPMNSVAICGNGNCGCACIAPYFATDFHTCELRSACPDSVNGSSNLVNNQNGTSSCTACPAGSETNGRGGCQILQSTELLESAVVLNSATVSQPETTFATAALVLDRTTHQPETASAPAAVLDSTTVPQLETVSEPATVLVTSPIPLLEPATSSILPQLDTSANVVAAVCAPGTVDNGSGTCVLTPSARARVPIPFLKRKRSIMCRKASETACSTSSGGFECLDVTRSFESCGGCPGEGGINCGDISGAMDVVCSRSKCTIFSCYPSWSYVRGTCVRK